MNPCAYPALNGINEPQRNSVDVDFAYPYDVVLTPLQRLVDEALAIHTDSDFCLRTVRIGRQTSVAFTLRFNDSQGYWLSSGPLYGGNFLSGGVPFPFVIHPEFIFPAGSRIGIEIADLSGVQNTIEILFEGAKRYRLQR